MRNKGKGKGKKGKRCDARFHFGRVGYFWVKYLLLCGSGQAKAPKQWIKRKQEKVEHPLGYLGSLSRHAPGVRNGYGYLT